MHRHIQHCHRAVCAVVASLMIGFLLLSACGRVAEGAQPDTTVPSSVPTAAGTATQVPTGPFTLDGSIEQLAQERWMVAGTPIALDAQTAITGTPVLGAIAHLKGEITADGTALARIITVEALATTSTVVPTATSVPTATPTPMPPPTATPLPPGTVVNITGVIENISITNNVTIVIVNSVTYVLPHNFVVLLGKRLRIGVPIVFVGEADTAGQIIIINVVQINNQVIIVNPPRHHDGDDDHEGDEGDD